MIRRVPPYVYTDHGTVFGPAPSRLSTSVRISFDPSACLPGRPLHPIASQVAQDPSTGALRPLEPGRIMAHSYLRLETMKAITQVRDAAGRSSGERAKGMKSRSGMQYTTRR
jgi:hypothetical protein